MAAVWAVYTYNFPKAPTPPSGIVVLTLEQIEEMKRKADLTLKEEINKIKIEENRKISLLEKELAEMKAKLDTLEKSGSSPVVYRFKYDDRDVAYRRIYYGTSSRNYTNYIDVAYKRKLCYH